MYTMEYYFSIKKDKNVIRTNMDGTKINYVSRNKPEVPDVLT